MQIKTLKKYINEELLDLEIQYSYKKTQFFFTFFNLFINKNESNFCKSIREKIIKQKKLRMFLKGENSN